MLRRVKELEHKTINRLLRSDEVSVERNNLAEALLDSADNLERLEELNFSVHPQKLNFNKFDTRYYLNYSLLGLLIISGIYLLNLHINSVKPNTVTVLVHGKKGKDQLVLPSRGNVQLIYGDAKISEQINNEGEATFKQIPEKFFNSGSRVEILFKDPMGEPYHVIYPDSTYRLIAGEYISIQVELKGLDQIRGTVRDAETGEYLDRARISIQNIHCFTDEYGFFELTIPERIQQKFHSIRAYKIGYYPKELSSVPIQTQQEIPILLRPTE